MQNVRLFSNDRFRRNYRRTIPLMLVLLGLLQAGCAKGLLESNREFGEEFWRHWGDGKAELSAYKLRFLRYRQPREGTAVAIFVTEDFLDGQRVKADSPSGDASPVLKLNLIRDFQTGVYDYNLMTSVFSALSPVGRGAGYPLKASFSSQEWCGHIYRQLLFDPQEIRETLHSYFENEADQSRTLEYPEHGVSKDMLFHWARGMAPPFLPPGGRKELPLLDALDEATLNHHPLEWAPAVFSRSDSPSSVTVPAGTFSVEEWSVTESDGTKHRVFVTDKPPHRIIKWESSTGEIGELLGSDRMKYWQMTENGLESALKQLGLERSSTAGLAPCSRPR